MHVFTTIIAVLLAVSASAFPFHKREPGGILLCTGANATGTCSYAVYPLSSVGTSQCQQLKPPFLENTNTFAPDGEHFECFPRTSSCAESCMSPTGCTFGAVDFAYEHKYNLSAIGWNKLINSFDCYAKTS